MNDQKKIINKIVAILLLILGKSNPQDVIQFEINEKFIIKNFHFQVKLDQETQKLWFYICNHKSKSTLLYEIQYGLNCFLSNYQSKINPKKKLYCLHKSSTTINIEFKMKKVEIPHIESRFLRWYRSV